mgnify:CR=1 FL=1
MTPYSVYFSFVGKLIFLTFVFSVRTAWKKLWVAHSTKTTSLTDLTAPTVSRMLGITSSWRYSLSACLCGFGLLFDKDLFCLFVFLHAYYFFYVPYHFWHTVWLLWSKPRQQNEQRFFNDSMVQEKLYCNTKNMLLRRWSIKLLDQSTTCML